LSDSLGDRFTIREDRLMIKTASPPNVKFLSSFESLDDPRQQAKVRYPLDEILLLVLCAVLSGADGWVEIATWGKKKLDFLRHFLPYAYGTPSHDQLGILFGALNAKQFQQCFIDWVSSLTKAVRGVVAVDGKTLRRAFDNGGEQGYIHMVSAWSSEQRLVLGQIKVSDKSNEITAIPELLDLLELKGAIVTIDAMGCQRDIAAKIVRQEADYVLALKGNQGTLHEDIELFFQEQKKHDFTDAKADTHETVEKDHGRLESRRVTVCAGIEWLQTLHQWPGLKSIIMVEYASSGIATRNETRYYIASFIATAPSMSDAIRNHWGIENGLHWVMDMAFRDDECRIRSANAPANFVTIKHAASNLLRNSPGKESLQLKRHIAAWDTDFLYDILSR
jgi:predicted transposase YbfD/YdcC